MSQVAIQEAGRNMLTATDLGMAEEEAELLSIAAIYDQIDILNDLLNAEVHGNVNSRDRWGLTPLHHAARNGSYKCVELLLQREADPDACSHLEDCCNTPLHHAAKIKNLRCIQLLLDYDASLDVRNIDGETAVDILKVQDGAEECISYIDSVIERRNREQEEHKREELYDLIEAGSFEQAQEMLNSIENKQEAINRYYKGPNTLLFKASYENHPRIVTLLLENGANGRPNGGSGQTPLYAACYAGHLEVVKILIERLPHLLMQPTKGDKSVPLHAAILRCNIEILRYLLNLRKPIENEVTDETTQRRTSLSRKNSAKDQASDTSILNVNYLNAEGISPLHLAVVLENKEAVLELLNCKPILKGLVNSPHPSCLAIDLPGISDETPLQFAIRAKNVEIARMLLLNGADPNRSALDAETLNPLQSACKSDNKDMVKLLLDHGANPNYFNAEKSSLSPLCIACQHDNVPVVKLLLEFGAQDFKNGACVEAVEQKRDHIVELFLETGVFEEADTELQEADLTSVRIIWNKRRLTELREQWIVNSVMRKNVNLFFSKKMIVDDSLQKDKRVVCRLITKLDLSGNELKTVPVLLFQLPMLRKLTLSDNKLTHLPCVETKLIEERVPSAQTPTGVTKQSNAPAEEAKEEAEGDTVDGVSNIQTEDLKWSCDLLEELELQMNELVSIPRSVFYLPCLKILNLYRNKIKELPLELWTAPGLKDVFLQENELNNLPSRSKSNRQQTPSRSHSRDDGVDARPHHSSSNVYKGAVKSKRPSWDGESTDESEDEDEVSKEKSGLSKLDVSNNKSLKALPLNLPCLAPNLCKLTVAGCAIEGKIVLSQLPPGLTMLDLSRNQISKFDISGNEPDIDRSCFILHQASLSKSSSLPGNLHKAKPLKKFCQHRAHRILLRLKNINLSENNLETLELVSPSKNKLKGDSFDCVVPDLQTLNLANNTLKTLPAHLGKLRKLLCLDITGNPKIETLPPEIGMCTQMYDLKFNAQCIRDPPRAIVEKKNDRGQVDVAYIRNFLKGVFEQSRPYPAIKLMFVGNSGKGKSTLLQRLRKEGTGTYQDPEYLQRFTDRMRDEPPSPRGGVNEDLSTVGVDVCDWTYQRRHIIGGNAGPEIKFSTWDFAGQEEYYATHTCFLTRRAIYLLVWKLTDGAAGIKQLQGWLLNIQARAPDSSVIIVGTHYDELPSSNRRHLVEGYRKTIFNCYVSESQGGSVSSLIEKGLPHVIAVTEVSSISSKGKAEYNIKELRNLIYEMVLSLRDIDNSMLLEAPVPASYLELERAVLSIASYLRKEKKYTVLDSNLFKTSVKKEMISNGFRELQDDELDNGVKFLHDCGVLLHFEGPAVEDLYFVDPQWLCDMLANVITIRDVNPFIRNGVLKIDDLKNRIFKGRRFSSNHVKKYIQLMNKFEVALKISSHYLLVPSLLPEKQSIGPMVSMNLNAEIQASMKPETYRKINVFRRQYRMSYVPSGFWARLITRLIADNRIGKTVTNCSEFTNVEKETPARIKLFKESLIRAAPPEWSCWRTGVELSCFGVKLLRVCQLEQNELFYGHDGKKEDVVNLSDSSYSTGRTPLIEILVPRARLFIEVDSSDSSDEKIKFKVATVKDCFPQTACEFLALTTEHFDNLLTDWFPALNLTNIHGEKSVRKIGLCPDCLSDKMARINYFDKEEMTDKVSEKKEKKKDDNVSGEDVNQGKRRSSKRGSESNGATQSRRRDAGKKKKPSFGKSSGKERKSGRKRNSNSNADSNKLENCDKNEEGANGLGAGDKFDPDRKVDANKKDVPEPDLGLGIEEGVRIDGVDEPGENKEEDEAENKDSNLNDDENADHNLQCEIAGFEFEEALKKSDAHDCIRCQTHGIIAYERLFPDIVFSDLPYGMVYIPEQICIEKFIAAGSYGAVFKASLQKDDQSLEIAVKVPKNTDAGNTINIQAKQDAMKNKKLKEVALTMFTTEVYTTIRQELSILLPINHKNVLNLIGVGLSPLRLLVEFAPKGSLDSILNDYKKVGRKLDPYTLQQCIIQVSSALEYLHDQSIIYRDLKSENVLVWKFPETWGKSPQSVNLKLADYGVSRAVAVAGMKGMLGTPGFIAPEILKFRGKESYSNKVDIFSFGSFLYELISQELPFQKYGGGQADQLMADNKRPRLSSGDKRIPIPVHELLYRCWEQDPQNRPTAAEVNAYAKLPEFSRLFDDLECEDQFRLQCAVSVFKASRTIIMSAADAKTLIGTELLLLSNDIKQNERDGRSGSVTVLNYVDGKCNVLKKVELNDIVLVACIVGSTIWIGMTSGAMKVYCCNTYNPLALGRATGSSSIISMLHSPACHCVLVGLTNDSIMSYNESISSHIHTIPQNEVAKHFGDVKHGQSIRELIASNVYPGDSIYNPVHCIAAVPSRSKDQPMEDVMTYYGADGEPLASSSREHKSGFDEHMKERAQKQNQMTYELWCGVDKGLINVFDLKELKKVHILAATGCEIDNPTIRNQSIKCIETRRVFSCAPTSNIRTPVQRVEEQGPVSVWVAVFPGTQIYRWNVDERKLEAKLDTLACSTDRELNSIKIPSRQKILQASQAQINSMIVVENEVYIGTSFGCMIICESMSLQPLLTLRCYSERVGYLMPLQMMLNSRGNTGRHKEKLMLCCGHGCLDKWNRGKKKDAINKRNCNILTWYADRWNIKS